MTLAFTSVATLWPPMGSAIDRFALVTRKSIDPRYFRGRGIHGTEVWFRVQMQEPMKSEMQ